MLQRANPLIPLRYCRLRSLETDVQNVRIGRAGMSPPRQGAGLMPNTLCRWEDRRPTTPHRMMMNSALSLLAMPRVDVVLGAVGMRQLALASSVIALLTAAASLLPIIRDWTNTRRSGAARAALVEAEVRQREAGAAMAEARSTLMLALVAEVIAGRPVPDVGDVLKEFARTYGPGFEHRDDERLGETPEVCDQAEDGRRRRRGRNSRSNPQDTGPSRP